MVSPLVCAEEREQEEAARREKERLWEVDEEEYEALTDEQKTELNKHIRQVQQERKKRSVSLPWIAPQDSVHEGFPCSGELVELKKATEQRPKVSITSGTGMASSTSLVPSGGRSFFW